MREIFAKILEPGIIYQVKRGRLVAPMDPQIKALRESMIAEGLKACTHAALIDALSAPLDDAEVEWKDNDGSEPQFPAGFKLAYV